MGKEFVVDSLEDMCALMCDNNTERLEERKMADVELVIKIPEELYRAYKDRPPMLGDVGMDMIAQAIANGTPLPKKYASLEKAYRQGYYDALKRNERMKSFEADKAGE